MKSYLPIVLSLSLLLTGCGLIPKRVELFQSKVKPFPEQSVAYTEVQKQTAQLAKDKAQETLIAAVTEKASTNVVVPAQATAQLTDAVSSSLGPPKNPAPSDESAKALADELRTQIAKLDRKIDSFKEANEKIEGKKIEGTGLLQIPYFLYLGAFVLIVVVGWHLLHTLLAAATVAGGAGAPAAAVGLGAMNVSTEVAGKAISQIVQGGEAFKTWVGKEFENSDLKQKILDAFTNSHKLAQDQDVKSVVNTLTK